MYSSKIFVIIILNVVLQIILGIIYIYIGYRYHIGFTMLGESVIYVQFGLVFIS